MTKASDNLFPKLILEETATDGSDHANPAADHRKLFLGEDGALHLKDSAGNVTDVSATEFAYAEFTSTVNITATAEASADTVVSAGAVTFDGSTAVIIEFYCPYARPDASASKELKTVLYDGASSIGILSYQFNNAAATSYMPLLVRRRITPSATSHTYSIRGFVSGGTGVYAAEAGGSGARMPGYIRITKA